MEMGLRMGRGWRVGDGDGMGMGWERGYITSPSNLMDKME